MKLINRDLMREGPGREERSWSLLDASRTQVFPSTSTESTSDKPDVRRSTLHIDITMSIQTEKAVLAQDSDSRARKGGGVIDYH
jgi:hypothetical protein